MNYSKEQFSQCCFNPLSDGVMLDNFPQLREVVAKTWEAKPVLDNLIRYVIMVYDPKSPLQKSHTNLIQRKRIASELSGISDLSKTAVEQILKGEYEGVLPLLIVDYLRVFARSIEFAILVATEQKIWETVKIIMQPLDAESEKDILSAIQKKEKVIEELERDKDRMESYFKTIFGDKDIEAEVRKKSITPQNIGL